MLDRRCQYISKALLSLINLIFKERRQEEIVEFRILLKGVEEIDCFAINIS